MLLLCKGFQILLDIQILNIVRLGRFAAVDDIPTGGRTKAVFCLGTLFCIDKMPVLIRHDFIAMLLNIMILKVKV